MKNAIFYILFGMAIVAAAVVLIVVSGNRADQAKAVAEAAASAEAQADAEKKAAQAKAQAEAEIRRTAEANAKAAADKLAAEKLANETAQLNAKTAENNAAAAAEAADKAELDAEAARAKREEAKLRAEAARDEKLKAESLQKTEEAHAAAEEAKAQAEALKSEKVIAEAKLLELQKIDFETAQQTLLEWKQDLEEREAALKPEKTIADLAWVGGGEDKVVDENGNLKKIEKKVYLPENDRTLTVETRALAKIERERAEAEKSTAEVVRATILGTLEPLYQKALEEDRVAEAEFYQKSIRSLYPDWSLSAEESKDTK